MKRKNKKHLAAALVLIVAALLLIILLPALSGEGRGKEEVQQENTEDVIAMMEIETPYCTLAYPEIWAEYLNHYGIEENGIYTESFSCVINGQELELFRVVFNDSETRAALGTLKVDGQKISVHTELQDLKLDESWAGSEDIVYAMADGVNDVIQSIQENETFKEVS